MEYLMSDSYKYKTLPEMLIFSLNLHLKCWHDSHKMRDDADGYDDDDDEDCSL